MYTTLHPEKARRRIYFTGNGSVIQTAAPFSAKGGRCFYSPVFSAEALVPSVELREVVRGHKEHVIGEN